MEWAVQNFHFRGFQSKPAVKVVTHGETSDFRFGPQGLQTISTLLVIIAYGYRCRVNIWRILLLDLVRKMSCNFVRSIGSFVFAARLSDNDGFLVLVCLVEDLRVIFAEAKFPWFQHFILSLLPPAFGVNFSSSTFIFALDSDDDHGREESPSPADCRPQKHKITKYCLVCFVHAKGRACVRCKIHRRADSQFWASV